MQKFLTHAKIKYIHEIVAYTFLDVGEKNHMFLSSIKKRRTQKKIGSFFVPHGVHGKEYIGPQRLTQK